MRCHRQRHKLTRLSEIVIVSPPTLIKTRDLKPQCKVALLMGLAIDRTP